MALWLTLVCLFSAPADRVQQAENWLAESEFELAAGEADTVLGLRTADTAQQVRLHRVAFLSRYYLGQKDLAAEQVRQWVALDAGAALDAKRFPPDVITFFNDTKAKAKPKSLVKAESPADSAKAPFDARSLIPLGIGHFLMGDRIGGGIFLGAEVAFLTANISLYAVRVKDRQAGDRYPNPGLASALQISQNVAAGLLCATVVVELVDALVFLPGRVASRPVRALLTPNGLLLAGEF